MCAARAMFDCSLRSRGSRFGARSWRPWNPPPSSSLAEEKRLHSLLLRAAARDLPTLAARWQKEC